MDELFTVKDSVSTSEETSDVGEVVSMTSGSMTSSSMTSKEALPEEKSEVSDHVKDAETIDSATSEVGAGAVPAPATTQSDKPSELEDSDELKSHLPWYVVHTYSGFEGRVKLSLEERIRTAGMQKFFGRIIVPQEKVVELVRGEKKTSTRKFFPGYMLIQCELNVETWHLVKDTPKVTGFVGDSHNPVPLSAQEVQNLFEQMEGGAQKARPKVQFEDGDSVKVIDGPFADFNGTVDEVKADKGKIRVLISIFGRNTPVELDFVQVEKV